MTDEELLAGVVMRFGIRSPEDMFFAYNQRPLVGDFDLGSTERMAAEKNQKATLSVWDEARTTIEQAQAFLSADRRLPIWLSVERIIAMHSLHVFRRPHAKELPGRDGHCEIENVWPSDRKSFKKIRSDLCDIATCDRSEIR